MLLLCTWENLLGFILGYVYLFICLLACILVSTLEGNVCITQLDILPTQYFKGFSVVGADFFLFNLFLLFKAIPFLFQNNIYIH